MRLFLISLFLVSATTCLLSCRQNTSGTLDYESLDYDTNKIVIFNWDTTKYRFPTNSNPLPLTHDDLLMIDSLIKDGIYSFNTNISPRMVDAFDKKVSIDSFIIKQEKYKYQYYPYKDVNGQRIMTIIGFSTDFQPWKDKMYQPRLHYGMRMFELKINLSEKTRDNLISGDFG